MRQMKRQMPIYTGDVSGVPSALYELGGMVIMHDASGCNSTYNTHDELRWYDKESLIYISAMTEIDAVMGNDTRLIQEITEAAEELKPSFIALAGTPIPYLNGMDFKGTAKVLTKKTGIPTFFVPTNGTHTYIQGVSGAYVEYLRHCVDSKNEGCTKSDVLGEGRKVVSCAKDSSDSTGNGKRVNILGVTPLDFALSGIEESMKDWLKEKGYQVQCCLSMGSTPEEVQGIVHGDVNLVVSSTGLEAAKYLEETCGIPYVVGTPVGCFGEDVLDSLSVAISTGTSQVAYSGRMHGEDAEIKIVGETVVSESIATAISKLYGKPVQVLCPVETKEGLLLEDDRLTMEEEEVEDALKGAKHVIGDPLLEFMSPEGATYHPLPHVGCSGRIYAGDMPDLMGILRER